MLSAKIVFNYKISRELVNLYYFFHNTNERGTMLKELITLYYKRKIR